MSKNRVKKRFTSEVNVLDFQPYLPQKKEGQGLTKIGLNATAYGKNIEARARIARGEQTRIEALVKLYGSS